MWSQLKKEKESKIPFFCGSKSVIIAEKILESSKKLKELKNQCLKNLKIA